MYKEEVKDLSYKDCVPCEADINIRETAIGTSLKLHKQKLPRNCCLLWCDAVLSGRSVLMFYRYILSLELLRSSKYDYGDYMWTGMAQSVWQPTMEWTVRGSNVGGVETFSASPDGRWDQPSLLYHGYTSVEVWWHTVTHGRGSEGDTGEWRG
jgi:hypothetical protein